MDVVRQGYYNGLTFHRAIPNSFVLGGSPGANDVMGATRYMRDEVGPQAAHVRGAVGMAARDNDAGDGQFFINLADQPQFDHVYTVFAYETEGMEFVDRILDGAKTLKVSIQ